MQFTRLNVHHDVLQLELGSHAALDLVGDHVGLTHLDGRVHAHGELGEAFSRPAA
jgi:hypothetical protein